MTGKAPRSSLIVIVDDDAEILQALAGELRSWTEVETFTSPRAALAFLKDHRASVVLSDLSMPEMNGIEFLSECERRRPETQRVLLTGHAELADLFDSINRAKLNFIVGKPWDSTELKSLLQSAVRASEIQAENIELRQIALTDALTSISNHRYFWERLESEFSRAQCYGRNLSFVMCDIDNFKSFNDQFGHQKGDSVLREVAQSLERNRRSMDSVARYGGEEFAIILPEVEHSLAMDIARRHLASTQKSCGISLSFGVATFPQDARSTTELVFIADQALLLAKTQGKARVVSSADVPKVK